MIHSCLVVWIINIYTPVCRRFLDGFWGMTKKEIEEEFSQQSKLVQNVFANCQLWPHFQLSALFLRKQAWKERRWTSVLIIGFFQGKRFNNLWRLLGVKPKAPSKAWSISLQNFRTRHKLTRISQTLPWKKWIGLFLFFPPFSFTSYLPSKFNTFLELNEQFEMFGLEPELVSLA